MIIKIEVKDLDENVVGITILTNALAHSLLSDNPEVKDELIEVVTKVLAPFSRTSAKHKE